VRGGGRGKGGAARQINGAAVTRVRIRVLGCRDGAAPVKLEGARPGGGGDSAVARWGGRGGLPEADESDSMTAMMGHVASDGGGHAFRERMTSHGIWWSI
jgi:hypothetical protein